MSRFLVICRFGYFFPPSLSIYQSLYVHSDLSFVISPTGNTDSVTGDFRSKGTMLVLFVKVCIILVRKAMAILFLG